MDGFANPLFGSRDRPNTFPPEQKPDKEKWPATPPTRPRVRLLDVLRGFSVVSMVAYHTMFDLVYFFGVIDAPWYRGLPGYLWQQSICWVFILVAGASLHYGRSPARHGLVVLACALGVTTITALAGSHMLVTFGILHMLGCSMLLFALLRPLLQKMPPTLGLALFGLLFVLFKGWAQGYLGLLDMPLLSLPGQLYGTAFLFPLGLPGPGFASSDYFPLIPWFFLLLAGYYGWALIKGWVRASTPGKNPLEWTGRHSLLIYMLHQPVVYGLLWVVFSLFPAV